MITSKATLELALAKLGANGVAVALIAQYPFLGLPVVRTLTNAVVTAICMRLIKSTEVGSYIIISVIDNNLDANKFDSLSSYNYEVQKEGSLDDKKKSEDELLNAARTMLKLTVSKN